MPSSRTVENRSKERTISAADSLTGPVRRRSNSEILAPSGTTSRPSRRRRSWSPARLWSNDHSRSLASARTSATKRAIVVTPGSNTLRSTHHAVARSNSALGPSFDSHALASMNPRSSPARSAKSL